MAIYDRATVITERRRRQWTITDVAERSDIDVSYLRDFEQGQRWLPPAYAERVETVLREHSAAGPRPLQLHDRVVATAERKRVGRSIADIAERSGIDIRYLSDFEQGRRWLSPHYAARLRTALRT